MIDLKDVVTIRVPYPSVASGLAVNSHMYVCMQDGLNKIMIKCQKEKPKHLNKSVPPFIYIRETPDLNRNPFKLNTLIDCDKKFLMNNVEIDKSLLSKTRRNVNDSLFMEINNVANHSSCENILVDVSELTSLNPLIKIQS